MFYRVATIFAQGVLVVLAGVLEARTGNPRLAWSFTLGCLAGLFLLFGLWHRVVLPRAAVDRPGEARRIPEFTRAFFATFGSFFRKPRIAAIVPFLLLYRLGEAQLVKMVAPFLLDARDKGGLALTTAQVGVVYGSVGIAALTLGGIVGGWMIARHGLKAWIWPMLFAIHLPDAAFLYLARVQPTSLALIQACIAVEQFGYGFGFTAYLMYMIWLARGRHQTAHYAICTGFMALGMMIPGMWSGWLQDHVGYPRFFLFVILATIPSFLVTLAIPLEGAFGRKSSV
jgi:PAT family beta-lactamase induction signal transducer AmpG